MARGDRVIAVSYFIRQHLLENYSQWLRPEHVRLIHRGVNCDYFDPLKIDPLATQRLREAWNLPSDIPIFLMPGRLTRWKGHIHIIRMLPFLEKVFVVFLGSHQGRKNYLKELQELASQLGVRERVRFIESCSTMREAYGLATGILHASTDPEAFGRVIAEAQSMGKPVLASHYGAGQEIILDKETGWLINPYDPQMMAQACTEMVSLSPMDQRHLAGKARKRVLEHFSLPLMMEKTLAVYGELLEKSES